MITATALLPAVCATRANFHAGGYLILNDLHTGRVRGFLIEIATSPQTGNTILQIMDTDDEQGKIQIELQSRSGQRIVWFDL